MNREHAEGLLYQALQTEIGGIEVYQNAIESARNDDLKDEWREYLDQTRTHRKKLLAVFETLGLDPDEDKPARRIVRDKAEALVKAMKTAREILSAEEAELVAGECVVDAETKDHLNWSLLEHVVEEGPKAFAEALKQPVSEVLEQESEHLFHTQGFTRELWLKHLGFPAALPPPEEQKSVQTKIGAGRAEHQRQDYIQRG